MMSFKDQLRFLVLLFFGVLVNAQNKSFFVSPPNYELISTDLHIHTVFSDGSVWPDIRVSEAIREGLDLISITDHLEYQPHKSDIPHPDRNRSFDIANAAATKKSLSVIRGAEITRSMPPGHINAVFVQDVNKLLFPDDVSAGIIEANKQNAFVFWNHPNWARQRPDGIAKLDPLHEELIGKGLIHGIEVANETIFSDEAITIALENNLTILGTSDIHGIADWKFKIPEGGHRPITFVLSRSKSVEDIKKALFEGKTMVWFKDLIIGREDHLSKIVKANLTASSMSYNKNEIIAKVKLKNQAATPLNLRYKGLYTFHEDSSVFIIPPYGEKTILVKTLERKTSLELPFELLNGITGAKKHLTFSLLTQ
jgi:hypothetical protein